VQGRYARMVATLRRVILFFDNLPEGTDVGNVGPQLARLRELVAGFEGHAIAQAAGRRLALASTAHTRILKQRLRIDHMRRIARMSHAALDLPTGTPAGICTIDSSESMPLSAWLWMGTPSTGRIV